MKAYCINLDRRTDRLEHMTLQFGRIGIPFERVAAVDGKDPAIAAAAAACKPGRHSGRHVSPYVYACFQSHREVWRRLVASGDSHAMVFEDDLVLAEGVAAYLEPGWVPADADVVRLETYGTRFHRDRGPGIDVAGRRLHRLRSRHAGTGCYALSAAAARRLLAATLEISDPVDEFMFDERSAFSRTLAVYQMAPAPVIQSDRLTRDPPSWGITSITDLYAKGDEPSTFVPEGTIGRFRRRMHEELRGLAGGTRYDWAPFG